MKRVMAVVLVVVASACAQPATAEKADRELETRVSRVRAAVEARNVALARSEILGLRTATESFARLGLLDEVRAARILAAAEGVIQQLPSLLPPATPSVVQSPPSQREEPPPEQGEDKEGDNEGEGDKDKGKGKGRGNGDDGGD